MFETTANQRRKNSQNSRRGFLKTATIIATSMSVLAGCSVRSEEPVVSNQKVVEEDYVESASFSTHTAEVGAVSSSETIWGEITLTANHPIRRVVVRNRTMNEGWMTVLGKDVSPAQRHVTFKPDTKMNPPIRVIFYDSNAEFVQRLTVDEKH